MKKICLTITINFAKKKMAVPKWSPSIISHFVCTARTVLYIPINNF